MTLIAGHTVTLFITDNTNTLLAIGGLSSLSMELNQQAIDTHTITEIPWRNLQAEAGSRSIRISATGSFCTNNAEDALRVSAFNATPAPLRFHFGNSDILSGDFIITKFIRSGTNDHSPAGFSFIAESAGDVSYG